jgi:hypothetical protein
VDAFGCGLAGPDHPLFSEKKEKGLDVWDAFLVKRISSTGIAGGETKIHFATDVV